MNLFDRLDLYVLGDRLHRERAVEQAAEKRLVEKKTQVEIPDHLQPVRHKVRAASKTPTAGPNAPLLKRLVRNPQVMDRGHFTRTKLDRFQTQPRQRPCASALFREAMSVERKAEKLRPMSLHPRLESRIRPSLDTWLEDRGDD